MFFGEAFASDNLKGKQNGRYQTSLKAYYELSEKIQPIEMYFNDFLLWFKEKETFNKQVNYLISFDIKEAKDIIRYLELERIDELISHPIQLKNGVYVRRKTTEQIEAIKKVLYGKINVKSSSSSYYLNAFEKHSQKSVLEEGKKIDQRIDSYLKVARTSKIVISICVSILFALITFKELQDTSILVSMTKLAIRLCTFVSCLYCGWQTETQVVKELAKKIENKTKILNIFKTSYETQEFKPSEYDDLARIEYEKYQEILNTEMKGMEGYVENIQ